MDDKFVLDEKVVKYETFLNERLREDLRKITEQKDKIYGEISEYLTLKTTIERIKEAGLTSKTKKPLKTRVDLGCNFYANAHIPNTDMILVKIGFGFFLELTLDEAIAFVDKRVAILETAVKSLTTDSARVKAHIKVVLEGLRELQGLK